MVSHCHQVCGGVGVGGSSAGGGQRKRPRLTYNENLVIPQWFNIRLKATAEQVLSRHCLRRLWDQQLWRHCVTCIMIDTLYMSHNTATMAPKSHRAACRRSTSRLCPKNTPKTKPYRTRLLACAAPRACTLAGGKTL
jgi:hypothetical protein